MQTARPRSETTLSRPTPLLRARSDDCAARVARRKGVGRSWDQRVRFARGLLAILPFALAGCKTREAPLEVKTASSASAPSAPPYAVASDVQSEARCEELRKLAEQVNSCNECVDRILAVLENPGSETLGICAAGSLPKVTRRVDALCAALTAEMHRSPYPGFELDAIVRQEGACKSHYAAIVDDLVVRMGKGGSAVSTLEIHQLETMFPDLDAPARQKLQSAAKALAKTAEHDGRTKLADAAKELSSMK
jgi:hypothetical protein